MGCGLRGPCWLWRPSGAFLRQWVCWRLEGGCLLHGFLLREGFVNKHRCLKNHGGDLCRRVLISSRACPLHLGRRTQVWQTEIHRANGKLACVSRLTTAVLDRKAE